MAGRLHLRGEEKVAGGCFSFVTLLYLLYFIGYVQCIYKAVNSNWEPIGKREIVYTGAILTGLGGIVGWFNIEDK